MKKNKKEHVAYSIRMLGLIGSWKSDQLFSLHGAGSLSWLCESEADCSTGKPRLTDCPLTELAIMMVRTRVLSAPHPRSDFLCRGGRAEGCPGEGKRRRTPFCAAAPPPPRPRSPTHTGRQKHGMLLEPCTRGGAGGGAAARPPARCRDSAGW